MIATTTLKKKVVEFGGPKRLADALELGKSYISGVLAGRSPISMGQLNRFIQVMGLGIRDSDEIYSSLGVTPPDIEVRMAELGFEEVRNRLT